MLVVSSDPLPSKSPAKTFIGELHLLGTEIDVAVLRLRAKSRPRLKRLIEGVRLTLRGLQHDNVVKPLVVEEDEQRLEVRVATPLAVASLEELLDRLEGSWSEGEEDDPLKELGIEWNEDVAKDVAVQILHGLTHLHRNFAEKADDRIRFFSNVKPSNVLLFSKGGRGGVDVKLSDFRCHAVRKSRSLGTDAVDERFRVASAPECNSWTSEDSFDQWSIADAEVHAAGSLLLRLFATLPTSLPADLSSLLSSMTTPIPADRPALPAVSVDPALWTPAVNEAALGDFFSAVDFRRKGLKERLRATAAPFEGLWTDERYGVDARLMEELRKRRKGGYAADDLLGLVEFAVDLGKLAARPTKAFAPLIEAAMGGATVAEYLAKRFPKMAAVCLEVGAEMLQLKEYLMEPIERRKIPKREAEKEEEDDEDDEAASTDVVQQQPLAAAEPAAPIIEFTGFRSETTRCHSDEDQDSPSPTKSTDDEEDVRPTTNAAASSATSASSVPTSSPADAVDELAAMMMGGAGSIFGSPAPKSSSGPAIEATSSSADSLDDLVAGFGSLGATSAATPNVNGKSSVELDILTDLMSGVDVAGYPGVEESTPPLDLQSLSEALPTIEASTKDSKQRIVKLKDELESSEMEVVRGALEALSEVEMTLHLLQETKIGMIVKELKKNSQEDDVKRLSSILVSQWKTLLPDVKGKENLVKTPPKKRPGYKLASETSTSDDLRLKSRKMILDAVFERTGETPSTRVAKNIAARVEEAVFQANKGDTGHKYRATIRSRVFNLRDPKNPELGDDVVGGAILAEEFAAMTADEMASKDMRRLREDLWQQANRERVLKSPRQLFLTRW